MKPRDGERLRGNVIASRKEGYASIAKYVTGFTVLVYFDHTNVRRAEICLKFRKASKQLFKRVADSQYLLSNVVRV